jgi:hypothetical protein
MVHKSSESFVIESSLLIAVLVAFACCAAFWAWTYRPDAWPGGWVGFAETVGRWSGIFVVANAVVERVPWLFVPGLVLVAMSYARKVVAFWRARGRRPDA